MSDGGTPPISSSAGYVNAGTSSGAADAENEIIDDKAPLWKFVKKIQKGQGRGGWKWQCNFCKLYSYTRVRSHLLKEGTAGVAICTKVTPHAFTAMTKLARESKERLINAAPRHVPLPSSQQQGGSSSTSSYGMSYHAGSVEKAFQNSAREQCDGEVARMYYTGGLSFNQARNPHYRNSYIRASTLPGYILPGYNALRTTLLAKERKNIEHHLKPIKKTWKDKGVSLCSDGWSDAQRRPLINVIATCESGPMMLKAINCQGEFKDHAMIAYLIIDSIKEVGWENVVQVITDNALVCSKASDSKYPTIFWTTCVVHTLNLAVKNICTPSLLSSNADVFDACCWIQPVSEDVMFIKNFIMNHGMRLVMFNDHCNLKLLSVAPTRWSSVQSGMITKKMMLGRQLL
ncbi:uncharacterized protein LOC112199422 [Rosa chinensis]|uniref:uncharacterized protein LOC112199422 n=1 Tax=Rosa chinensis TaxID=74649 RepID=UPI000D096CBD|nr:uncharacterized protein LOC112199422 [Rosa chinensis]